MSPPLIIDTHLLTSSTPASTLSQLATGSSPLCMQTCNAHRTSPRRSTLPTYSDTVSAYRQGLLACTILRSVCLCLFLASSHSSCSLARCTADSQKSTALLDALPPPLHRTLTTTARPPSFCQATQHNMVLREAFKSLFVSSRTPIRSKASERSHFPSSAMCKAVRAKHCDSDGNGQSSRRTLRHDSVVSHAAGSTLTTIGSRPTGIVTSLWGEGRLFRFQRRGQPPISRRCGAASGAARTHTNKTSEAGVSRGRDNHFAGGTNILPLPHCHQNGETVAAQ